MFEPFFVTNLGHPHLISRFSSDFGGGKVRSLGKKQITPKKQITHLDVTSIYNQISVCYFIKESITKIITTIQDVRQSQYTGAKRNVLNKDAGQYVARVLFRIVLN